jgi:hypothetical protein
VESTYASKKTTVNNGTEMSRMARRHRKNSWLSYIFKTQEISQWMCGFFLRLVDRQQKREEMKRGEGKTSHVKSGVSFIHVTYAAFFIVLIASITYFMAR